MAWSRPRTRRQLHDYWQKVAAHWDDVAAAGKIKSYLHPGRARAVAATIADKPAKIAERESRLPRATRSKSAITTEGFNRDTFESAFALLDELHGATVLRSHLPDWRTELPQSVRLVVSGRPLFRPRSRFSRRDLSPPTSRSRPRSKRKCCIASFRSRACRWCSPGGASP